MREYFAILGYHADELMANNPWFSASTKIATFQIDELQATKLRALYQRRKGRDLFDLWLTISRGLLDPQRVITCFGEYMSRERHTVSRAQFEENLHEKQADAAFLEEVKPLLSAEIAYDGTVALAQVRELLIEKLPGDPWRGVAPSAPKKPRPRRKKP